MNSRTPSLEIKTKQKTQQRYQIVTHGSKERLQSTGKSMNKQMKKNPTAVTILSQEVRIQNYYDILLQQITTEPLQYKMSSS